MGRLDCIEWDLDDRFRIREAGPVQGEGHIDGLPAYFRARHQGWSMAISSDPDGDAVETSSVDLPGWYAEGNYGRRSDASHMLCTNSRRIIEAFISAFRAHRALDPHPARRVVLDLADLPTGPA